MKSINAVAMTFLSTLFVSEVCLSATISNPDRFQHEGKLNAYLRSVYINTRISNELIEDRFGGFPDVPNWVAQASVRSWITTPVIGPALSGSMLRYTAWR